jgi:hypothetical protein
MKEVVDLYDAGLPEMPDTAHVISIGSGQNKIIE